MPFYYFLKVAANISNRISTCSKVHFYRRKNNYSFLEYGFYRQYHKTGGPRSSLHCRIKWTILRFCFVVQFDGLVLDPPVTILK